jgi:hypothetical protein
MGGAGCFFFGGGVGTGKALPWVFLEQTAVKTGDSPPRNCRGLLQPDNAATHIYVLPGLFPAR